MNQVIANIRDFIQEERRKCKALGGPGGNTYGDGFNAGVIDICNRLQIFIDEEMESYDR